VILPDLSVESLKSCPCGRWWPWPSAPREGSSRWPNSRGTPSRESRRAAVEAALRAAEDFARGVDPSDAAAVVRDAEATSDRPRRRLPVERRGLRLRRLHGATPALAALQAIENWGRVAAPAILGADSRGPRFTEPPRLHLRRLRRHERPHGRRRGVLRRGDAQRSPSSPGRSPTSASSSTSTSQIPRCRHQIDPSPAGPLGPLEGIDALPP